MVFPHAAMEATGRKAVIFVPSKAAYIRQEQGKDFAFSNEERLAMLRAAAAICEIYPTLDADLLAAGVILHDLCKITEMESDEIGVVSDYTAQGMLIGHLVQGVAELDRCGRKLKVRPELLMMLEHMILSHHDLPEYGSPKPPMFPEAEALHALDLLDARIFEMNRELQNAQPGGFTERIWSLERKLYRRKEPPRRKAGAEDNEKEAEMKP